MAPALLNIDIVLDTVIYFFQLLDQWDIWLRFVLKGLGHARHVHIL